MTTPFRNCHSIIYLIFIIICFVASVLWRLSSIFSFISVLIQNSILHVFSELFVLSIHSSATCRFDDYFSAFLHSFCFLYKRTFSPSFSNHFAYDFDWFFRLFNRVAKWWNWVDSSFDRSEMFYFSCIQLSVFS